MATTQDYAALALYVYDVRRFDINRPQLPTGWTLAEPLHRDDLLGFSYGVFRSPSGEIVLSYAGTNEIIGDWASNLIAAVGLVPAPQLVAAAKAYLDVKAAHGANITLSGHSLGGGLASVVATWFDRPAVVFDAAPFQLSAQSPTVWTLTGAVLGLAGYSDTAFDRAIFDFAIREQQVAHHYLDGEALMLLRASLPVIAGSETPLQVGGLGLNPVQLHSMALYTVAKLSPSFVQATYVSQRILLLIMDDKLYASNTATSTERNFLLDLIRSEQQNPDNSKLDHFAADLNKLGTNIAGLNVAAQNAIIAQGIEWYYWQGTDYAGQEFFTKTGELLQYTSAIAEGLTSAQNRAGNYTRTWLDTAYTASTGETRFAPFGTGFDQWSVGMSVTTGVTATARDATKSQIFIGQGGADTFTGGDQADVIMAAGGDDTLNGGAGYDLLYGGAGNDTLNGGTGSDFLYGSAGNDTYTFTGDWGSDTIIDDSAGQGSIVIDGVTIVGGKKIAGQDNVWQNTDQGYTFTLAGTAAGPLLVISKDGSLNTIRVQGSRHCLLA